MAGPQKKYDKLLENKDLRRWYNEAGRTSEITADTYMRRLGSFCAEMHTTPEELISREEKDVTDIISDYISREEAKKMSGAYILSTIKAVKSWLTYNNRKLTRKIRISDSNVTSSLKDERIPTQDELKAILSAGDPRSRAATILMAHSGMRPEVLGNYKGTDGLKIGDFIELKIEHDTVTFEKMPTMIVVRPELSKARKQYITFLGPEGCFYIKGLIEARMREGEKITKNSPLITPSKLALRNEISFIRTINIGDLVRQSIRSTAFKGRPYVLRSFFDTQLMLAESKGLIMRDYRVFFMGHVGDMEHRYTLNKQRLPEEIVEDMRSAYSRCLKFLETEEKGISEKQHKEEIDGVKIMMLKMAGYTEDEINKGNFLDMDITEVIKKFDEKRAKALNNGNSQKVVPFKDVEMYIEQGWEYLRDFPGDKAIIKLPS